MGTLADSLFAVLMSWVRALVSGIWALFSSEHTTLLEFLGKNWMMFAVVIIAAGLVIDWIIWLLRWQPYHLWAQRARRLLRLEEPEEDEEEEETGRVRVAVSRGTAFAAQHTRVEQQIPPVLPEMDEWDERRAMENADSVPDEALRAYPGMRYDSYAAREEELDGTQRYAAVRSEGPGAAEVNRRRAEIDAWKLQMQEEARAAYEAEQACLAQEAYEAEQARLAQEAYEAEQARLAQEAYEAEQARLAQEAYEAEQARLAQEAYEAEQARLAQEAYQAELAEYERQKAQYERDLAEYERQKAEYEAYLASREAAQQSEESFARRRRTAERTYSDYVAGETVGDLPDPPAWPTMQKAEPDKQDEKKRGKGGSLMSRMARMIEPEEEALINRTVLPPRVDMRDAYGPAKAPKKGGKRKA